MDAGLIFVTVLVALLAVLLVALFRRPRRQRKPDAVIHIIRNGVDYPTAFFDKPKKRRR